MYSELQSLTILGLTKFLSVFCFADYLEGVATSRKQRIYSPKIAIQIGLAQFLPNHKRSCVNNECKIQRIQNFTQLVSTRKSNPREKLQNLITGFDQTIEPRLHVAKLQNNSGLITGRVIGIKILYRNIRRQSA